MFAILAGWPWLIVAYWLGLTLGLIALINALRDR